MIEPIDCFNFLQWSYRNNKSLARLFTGFKKMALDQVRRGCVVRDVQQYILGRLERESSLRRHLTRETAPALNMLHIKSHGCLLYVETLLDGVSDGSVLLRDIPEIPGTLNGLYLWLCQRLFTRRSWNKVFFFLFSSSISFLFPNLLNTSIVVPILHSRSRSNISAISLSSVLIFNADE